MEYEEKFEEMDNKLSYKKISLEKLKDQQHFMQEQLVRFREELENLRIAKRQSEIRRMADEVKSRRSSKYKRHVCKRVGLNLGYLKASTELFLNKAIQNAQKR